MEYDVLHVFDQFFELTAEEKQFLQNKFYSKTLEKNEQLVEERTVCRCISIIREGYARIYVNKEVEEKTIHLAKPGDFLCAFDSFICQQPSDEVVEAITPLSLLCIDYDTIQEVYEHSKRMERLGRLIVQQMFVRKERRVISLIKYSGQEHYQHLIEHDPDLANNVPLQYIASYLGIKPETLSRIRSKKIQ